MSGGSPPLDHFAAFNALAIVIAMDKTLVSSSTNPLINVWASTNK